MRVLQLYNWRLAAAPILGAAGALALLWLTRSGPRALGPIAADSLSGLFLLALFFGLALAAANQPASPFPWRMALAALAASAGMLTPYAPLIILAYIALAALALPPRDPARRDPARLIWPLAAALLALGYGALALGGGLRYDDRSAGAALESPVFFAVLLAAAAPLLPAAAHHPAPLAGPLRLAWLYPLARLYALGPWNEGWTLAAVLFGAAIALWCASAALGRAAPHATGDLLAQSQLAMALAGFGLSTGAGVAAGGLGLLCYALLAAAAPAPRADAQEDWPLAWLLTPAAPFAAPFVAAWMLLGAAVAGGVSLAGAAAWLAGLLAAAACLLARPWRLARPALALLGGASLALGVLAPLAVRLLVQPAIEQLQGGLSVYGDVNIWPWVGLAAVDSARRGVTALPSIAVAALMLLLTALLYLAARLRAETGPTAPAGDVEAPHAALLDRLRAEVPWLGAGRGRGGDAR